MTCFLFVLFVRIHQTEMSPVTVVKSDFNPVKSFLEALGERCCAKPRQATPIAGLFSTGATGFARLTMLLSLRGHAVFPIRDTVPRRSPPFMVWAIISLNASVFLIELEFPAPLFEWFTFQYGLVPARYSNPIWALRNGLNPTDYWPFLTNTFLHGGWMHLIGNMWTLWIFGAAVEDRLGPWRFLSFYLACGVLASIVHFAFNMLSPIPALGASGAISGVLGAYALMFPLARILFVIPIFIFPFFFEFYAFAYAVAWFILQIFQGAGGLLAPEIGGSIAWWAHIGGFVAGLSLLSLFRLPQRRYRRYYLDEGVLGHGIRGE